MSYPKGHSPSEGKLAVVADTSALLAKIYYYIPSSSSEVFTTSDNVEEVKDRESAEALRNAIEIGLVRVLDPEEKYIKAAVEKSRSIGELAKLSTTDLKLAALALMLSERGKVVVFTDDYSLQNLLLQLGVGFKPLKTYGIREPRKYRVRCPACGYVPANAGETVCPVCGTPIVKRRAS